MLHIKLDLNVQFAQLFTTLISDLTTLPAESEMA